MQTLSPLTLESFPNGMKNATVLTVFVYPFHTLQLVRMTFTSEPEPLAQGGRPYVDVNQTYIAGSYAEIIGGKLSLYALGLVPVNPRDVTSGHVFEDTPQNLETLVRIVSREDKRGYYTLIGINPDHLTQLLAEKEAISLA